MDEPRNGTVTYRDLVLAVDKLRDDVMERMDKFENRIVDLERSSGTRFRAISSCDSLMTTMQTEIQENRRLIEMIRKRELGMLSGIAAFGIITIVGLFIFLLQFHIV